MNAYTTRETRVYTATGRFGDRFGESRAWFMRRRHQTNWRSRMRDIQQCRSGVAHFRNGFLVRINFVKAGGKRLLLLRHLLRRDDAVIARGLVQTAILVASPSIVTR